MLIDYSRACTYVNVNWQMIKAATPSQTHTHTQQQHTPNYIQTARTIRYLNVCNSFAGVLWCASLAGYQLN